jgi:hypothetical protein
MQMRIMKNTTRLMRGLTAALFALVVSLFFGYYYPHHLHYQEQFQLFELTAPYARQALWLPGGMADYVGGFLTQFFVNSRLGGLLLALTLLGIQHFIARRCRHRRLVHNDLSYWPAWVMLYYLTDENAMPAAAVALLGALMMADALARLRGRGLRLVLLFVLTPLSYLLWGSVALLFVGAMAIEEAHRGWNARCTKALLATAVLLTACPLAAQYEWHYPLSHLFWGLHYFRYPAVFPTHVWVAVALTLLVMALSLALKDEARPADTPRWKTVASESWNALFIVMCTALIPRHYANWDKEEVMAYDFYARYQQWGEILKLANQKSPSWMMSLCNLNLALGVTGHLPDYQFRYFQCNEQGLFPDFERDFTSPLVTSEAFYQLGFINTAQRYTFEAQEAIPDGQRSVRCYQRLAETALINGDYPIARKYLRSLRHTLFYKKWADNLWALTEQPDEPLDERLLYSRLRNHRNPEDYLFSDTEIDAMLGRQFLAHKDNRLAYEYLMSYELLSRRLDLVAQYCRLGESLGYPKLPRAYQEALLLHWTLQHTDFRGFPWQVDPAVQQQMVRFIQDYRANRPMSYMRQAYAGTYWLFYIQETKTTRK